MNTKTRRAYRVCGGRLFVNDEAVPVNHRILKIGLAAAGLEPQDCAPLLEAEAKRILHMERAWLLAGLTAELGRVA